VGIGRDRLKAIKIFVKKRERWHIQRLSKFIGYTLLFQKRVKLRTLNFVSTFIG